MGATLGQSCISLFHQHIYWGNSLQNTRSSCPNASMLGPRTALQSEQRAQWLSFYWLRHHQRSHFPSSRHNIFDLSFSSKVLPSYISVADPVISERSIVSSLIFWPPARWLLSSFVPTGVLIFRDEFVQLRLQIHSILSLATTARPSWCPLRSTSSGSSSCNTPS